jgi:hypothetical protein
MLAVGFAVCCVVLLMLDVKLQRQARTASEEARQMRRQALDQGRQLSAWQAESRRNATNLQLRLTDSQRQMLQKTLEFEREKGALENQLQARTTEWEQNKVALQRQLAAKTADGQALEEALSKALAENRDRLAPLRAILLWQVVNTTPPTAGTMVWDEPQQRGLLLLENLGPPPPGQDYQLWLHDPKFPVPISAGVLSVADGGRVRFLFKPVIPIDQIRKVTISVERRGGVDKPEGQVVMESR